jgi:hypothetical protein
MPFLKMVFFNPLYYLIRYITIFWQQKKDALLRVNHKPMQYKELRNRYFQIYFTLGLLFFIKKVQSFSPSRTGR